MLDLFHRIIVDRTARCDRFHLRAMKSTNWSKGETVRSHSESTGHPAEARDEPGAVLDQDRRHTIRWISLREWPGHAEAGTRTAASGACGKYRFVPRAP